MIKIGIIGIGHWGKNYLRIFSNFPDVEVIFVCDINKDIISSIKNQYPSINFIKDYSPYIDKVDGVIISTIASTHFEIASQFLKKGKHLLIEKPMTLDIKESEKILDMALKNNLTLMVAHTFIYNTGIKKIKEYIDKDKLGQIYYMNATRTHLGLIREDVNAIWDLAPHDISIFNYILDSNPIQVSALGACHLKEGREDVAFINLLYPDNIIANIHVSWADSNKERTIRVVGSDARLIFNDLDNLERIKLYEKGISLDQSYDTFGEFQYILRDGDIISPSIELKEPLKELVNHFIECIKENKTPITDGQKGLEVVKVLKAIETSLNKKGEPVKIV